MNKLKKSDAQSKTTNTNSSSNLNKTLITNNSKPNTSNKYNSTAQTANNRSSPLIPLLIQTLPKPVVTSAATHTEPPFINIKPTTTSPLASAPSNKTVYRNTTNTNSTQSNDRNDSGNYQIVQHGHNSYTNKSINYATITTHENTPKIEQAIVFNIIENVPKKEYILAIGKLVDPSKIIFVSRITNNRFCIFLSSLAVIDKLLETTKTIKCKAFGHTSTSYPCKKNNVKQIENTQTILNQNITPEKETEDEDYSEMLENTEPPKILLIDELDITRTMDWNESTSENLPITSVTDNSLRNEPRKNQSNATSINIHIETPTTEKHKRPLSDSSSLKSATAQSPPNASKSQPKEKPKLHTSSNSSSIKDESRLNEMLQPTEDIFSSDHCSITLEQFKYVLDQIF
ncbi:uncharacterized protein LOC126845005 [Adelges cooleyi]|uniref:uncharacterized protein LOC126845005 n=1 Tax=Adelges cooleyi TaxID=133065 RepID=UPI00218017B6|nr:uncharacterized protein LOC126845005 [Adelges cooleyi]